MSAEHGETLESGGDRTNESLDELAEVISVAPSDVSAPAENEDDETIGEAKTDLIARVVSKPTMEALQPRRTIAARRAPDPHAPLPMLLPAVPMSIPHPQTPAPELLPIPARPNVPDPQTPLQGIVLN